MALLDDIDSLLGPMQGKASEEKAETPTPPAEDSGVVEGKEKEGESGSFEQDADTIIFIHRDRETDSDEIDTDLFVAKQRDGAIGIAKTTFYTNVVTFKDRQK